MACQVAEVAALYQVVGLESSAAALLAAEPASGVFATTVAAVVLGSEPLYLFEAFEYKDISGLDPYSAAAVSVALLAGLCAFEAALLGLPNLPED